DIMSTPSDKFTLRLRAGELVQVKSKEEILSTLSVDGCLDGLPFMPEMLKFCGARLRVYKRAHKTCDTVFQSGSRKMARTVHLERGWSGAAHGGCQAGCLIFWKEAWLTRVHPEATGSVQLATGSSCEKQCEDRQRCSEQDLIRSTQTRSEDGLETAYACQATQLPYATTRLHWWDCRQYLEDYYSGNVTIFAIVRGLIHSSLFRLSQLRKVGWRIPSLYDQVIHLWGGSPWPQKGGRIPMHERTPTRSLNLKPGELVRVKPFEEILQTLNRGGQNRGLRFDKEMVPYCGGEYRVLKRI